jgi:phosphogluconate dehydratase
MSGASGSVPAAIHLTPECVRGGALARVRDGDIIRLDSVEGRLEAHVPAETWQQRECAKGNLSGNEYGFGRELFAPFRAAAGDAEGGAMSCGT